MAIPKPETQVSFTQSVTNFHAVYNFVEKMLQKSNLEPEGDYKKSQIKSNNKISKPRFGLLTSSMQPKVGGHQIINQTQGC